MFIFPLNLKGFGRRKCHGSITYNQKPSLRPLVHTNQGFRAATCPFNCREPQYSVSMSNLTPFSSVDGTTKLAKRVYSVRLEPTEAELIDQIPKNHRAAVLRSFIAACLDPEELNAAIALLESISPKRKAVREAIELLKEWQEKIQIPTPQDENT